VDPSQDSTKAGCTSREEHWNQVYRETFALQDRVPASFASYCTTLTNPNFSGCRCGWASCKSCVCATPMTAGRKLSSGRHQPYQHSINSARSSMINFPYLVINPQRFNSHRISAVSYPLATLFLLSFFGPHSFNKHFKSFETSLPLGNDQVLGPT
jgi:hypothetical protein